MTRSKLKQKSSATGTRSAGSLLSRLVGLLTGCSVTLVGVLRGLDPDAILVRALVAGLVMGLTTSLVHRLMTRLATR